MKGIVISLTSILIICCTQSCIPWHSKELSPVDYVNPYIGNISHLLVPTYPTVHLPNSMMRFYPEREDYTSELIHSLPLIVPSHRHKPAFNINPICGKASKSVRPYTYDKEKVSPYSYEVTLNDSIDVKFAPSHQSAIFKFKYLQADEPAQLIVCSTNGDIRLDGNAVAGHQLLENNTKVYMYLEVDVPSESKIVLNGVNTKQTETTEKNVSAVMTFPAGTKEVSVRYGVSFISEEQAKSNLRREIQDFNIDALRITGREKWNEVLSKIEVKGGAESDMSVFYTSLYRTFERPICISEDGYYFSAFDGKVHEDHGTPFYTDDWIWDTYRATHPLRVLIAEDLEKNIIASYIRMAEQMGTMWMPTFPEVTGDSRRMNSNHAVATIADALSKGLEIDAVKAYEACRKAIEEKTLAPWSGNEAGWIDDFYKKHGYIPALKEEEQEADPNVHNFEKRQPVAVTLGTSYDQWCLSQIAGHIGLQSEAEYYLRSSYNYRNLFNPATSFFHPKDKEGNWIRDIDYSFPGGMGAREYYCENNAWIYRWDVPHNIADLVSLMGGKEAFIANLDQTFQEPLNMAKYMFYAKLPDHTGNVGQFSMANEPSMHIPYLYNYVGQPWKTQKCIHKMLNTWFRDDLMGIPGDEDGGGMTAFVVFSYMGFYPVTPGMPSYNIGSPGFDEVVIHMSNGNDFIVKAKGASADNKYIHSATLNNITWDKPWFSHDVLRKGGYIEFEMSDMPNKEWGTDEKDAPPSATIYLK